MRGEAPALVSAAPEAVAVERLALGGGLLAARGVGEAVGAVVAATLGTLNQSRQGGVRKAMQQTTTTTEQQQRKKNSNKNKQ